VKTLKRPLPFLLPTFAFFLAGCAVYELAGCAVSEEVRQIERVKQAQKEEIAGRSDQLAGQQVFIRSCNTCHPGGKAGVGVSLDEINNHFPTDAQLAKFIRKGSGQMPPQPPSVLTDQELANLISYLRSTHAAQKEATPGQ
jgi:mono/diheme cytochrome c family protein